MSSLSGQTIDSYELLEVLGNGGMGIVYKARDTVLDRVVAIKIMDAELAIDTCFQQRFQSEAKALARLKNQHIVSIYTMRETDAGFCIVMEYIEGVTLEQYLRAEGRVRFDVAMRFCGQMLEALEHAHGEGIIHRDIKPANVMLDCDGKIKITDFGLAKFQTLSGMTRTGSAIGTIQYMSPEQVNGETADQRSDIWSIGVLMYKMLTGKLPFQHEYYAAMAYSITNEDPVHVRRRAPDVPDALARIVSKCLEKKPNNRYQNASEMHRDVRALMQNEAAAQPGIGRLPGDRWRTLLHSKQKIYS
ncbi:MAG: serine/threonine protein kinase [Ignavibacteria bacterium]|nr:serine/threonine protein kinase [Ignavibacteria bacterium]